MEKAYDFGILLEEYKKLGLDMSEEVLAKSLDVLLKWFKESAMLSSSPYDDMALVILPKAEELLKGLIDKIDGQEG